MTNLKNLDMDYFKRIAERVNREKTLEKKVEVSHENKPSKSLGSKTNPVIKDIPIQNPVLSNDTYWIIPNVNYRNSIGDVQILRGFLESGDKKSQRDWEIYTQSARLNGRFYTPDLPLIFSTLSKVYPYRTNVNLIDFNNVEKFRKEILKITGVSALKTLTKIVFDNDGPDRIIHNQGISYISEFQYKCGGSDGEIPAGSPETFYQKLLGTQKSVQEISSVFKWLNGTKTLMFRWDKEYEQIYSNFYTNDTWVVIDHSNDIDYPSSSMGMRFIEYAGSTIN